MKEETVMNTGTLFQPNLHNAHDNPYSLYRDFTLKKSGVVL